MAPLIHVSYADDHPRTRFLRAARVPPTIQPQQFGLWTIERREIDGITEILRSGWPTQTILFRATVASLHKLPGEVVMEDSREELLRHMPIWRIARGRVLVTGLGLGCALRGILTKPEVDHVDVVEIDKDILRVIGRTFDDPRVTFHHGDALTYDWPVGTRWDVAWHDLHQISDQDDRPLQLLHVELFLRYERLAGQQGAWMFPRFLRQAIKRDGSWEGLFDGSPNRRHMVVDRP